MPAAALLAVVGYHDPFAGTALGLPVYKVKGRHARPCPPDPLARISPPPPQSPGRAAAISRPSFLMIASAKLSMPSATTRNAPGPPMTRSR